MLVLIDVTDGAVRLFCDLPPPHSSLRLHSLGSHTHGEACDSLPASEQMDTAPVSYRFMPLSAVIVDDEQLARDELAYLLKQAM